MKNKVWTVVAVNVFVACLSLLTVSCRCKATVDVERLEARLAEIVAVVPGEVGVALITDGGDTVTINGIKRFPMMSVYKLHQAIAVCNLIDSGRIGLLDRISIPRSELNPDTWSPMLKRFTADTINIDIHDLLFYSVTLSDNNASNYLFHNVASPAEVDSYMKRVLPHGGFDIRYTEAEMLEDHARAFDNFSTPLAAVEVIDKVYSKDPFMSENMKGWLRHWLEVCQTGEDRIIKPLIGKEGYMVGHKTGSGFKDGNLLAAHNDVAHVILPDGGSYSLAVMIKNFHGDEQQASEVIADISSVVLDCLK